MNDIKLTFIKVIQFAFKIISLTFIVSAVIFIFTLKTINAQTLQTPLVLISDIDDTIKVSHVRDKLDAFVNIFHTENVFRGMPEMYNLLTQGQPTMPVFYLTNAPEFLMKSFHADFLEQNHFPNGKVLLRKNLSDKNHKVNKIHQIIKTLNPKAIILFGDNGEHDPEVYDLIRRQYPDIQFYTYIHQLYNENKMDTNGDFLKAEQKGFVTPVEVVIDLANKNIISDQSARNFIDNIGIEILMNAEKENTERSKRGKLSFPSWKNFSEFKWNPNLKDQELNREVVLRYYKQLLKVHCSKVLN